MLELGIFLIAFVAAFIGIMIPGVASALSVSSMILLGIPIQLAKTTYQVGNLGINLGGLLPLLKTQKLQEGFTSDISRNIDRKYQIYMHS